jgi:hypothetical protein
MKSRRLVIIATLVFFAIVSVANAGEVPGNKPGGKVIDITLNQAMSNLGLVAAINQQVSINEVLNSTSIIYTAQVSYQDHLFQITGTHDQWISFFKMNRSGGSFTTGKIIKQN